MSRLIETYGDIVVVTYDDNDNVIPFNRACEQYLPKTQQIELYSKIKDIDNLVTQGKLVHYYV